MWTCLEDIGIFYQNILCQASFYVSIQSKTLIYNDLYLNLILMHAFFHIIIRWPLCYLWCHYVNCALVMPMLWPISFVPFILWDKSTWRSSVREAKVQIRNIDSQLLSDLSFGNKGRIKTTMHIWEKTSLGEKINTNKSSNN